MEDAMNYMNYMNFIPLVGRVLFVSMFLYYGRNHFTNYDGISGYAEFVGVPLPGVATIVGGLLLVVGGVSILLGLRAKIGAILVIAFLLTAAFIVHDYWTLDADSGRSLQEILFWRNISGIGAALLIVYFGSGPFSLDEVIDRRLARRVSARAATGAEGRKNSKTQKKQMLTLTLTL
jgi:putative oxidoreductase